MQKMSSLLLYLFIFLFSSFLLNTRNQKNKYSYYLGLAILIIFAAGRYKVGTDFWNYERVFQRLSSYSFPQFLNRLLSDNEQLFMILCRYTYKIGGRVLTWGTLAALILVLIIKSSRDLFSDFSFGTAIASFLFTGFASSFNVCREYIAIAIIFYSLKYVFNNKINKFVICIILSFFFHSSSLIALSIWFFWDHRNGKVISGYKRYIIIIITLIGTLIYKELITLLGSRFSLFESYVTYYTSEIESTNRDFYVSLLTLFVCIIFSRKIFSLDDRSNYFLLLIVVSTIIGITGFSHPQFKRVGLYFSIPGHFFFSGYIPKCMKHGQEKIGSTLIIGFYIIMFTIVYYIIGQSHLIPYHFDLVSSVF